jgi:hypothetical protein
MVPAVLIAFSLLANAPADQPPPAGPTPAVSHAKLKRGPHAVAAAVSETSAEQDDGDIPPGAPTDDYGFVAWCYGALDEYLTIYDAVIPDLKAIDEMFGTSVKEDRPYTADVAAERVALKRFGAAIEAAERASPTPITEQGVADIQAGRGIWARAKLQPRRKLADAWLFWGIPRRCETAAKTLTSRAAGRPTAQLGPTSIELAAAEPAPGVPDSPAPSPNLAPARAAPPAGPPPRAGAVLIEGR